MSEETQSAGQICARWWRGAIAADTGPARKTRAQLRRADTALAALGIAAVHDLNRALKDGGYDLRKRPDGPDRLALIAVALAHVSETGPRAARSFGAGDPPALSPMRFDALIRAEAPRDLIRPMVRALRVVRGAVNPGHLANDLYWWTERTRTEWCFEYHGASGASPEQESEETEA